MSGLYHYCPLAPWPTWGLFAPPQYRVSGVDVDAESEIESIEYHENGTIKKVVYREPKP